MLLHSNLQIPSEKVLGLGKFFLGIGLPGSTKDCFNQIESLSFLENNRQAPFIALLFTPLLVIHTSVPFLFAMIENFLLHAGYSTYQFFGLAIKFFLLLIYFLQFTGSSLL